MSTILILTALKAFTKLTAVRSTSNKCLLGKTAIITGSTSGIGYETMKVLASRGCRIYITGTIQINEDIMKLLRTAFNNEHLYYYPVNMSSLNSVREFCDHVRSREEHVDILIHNAEKVGNPRIITNDNIIQVMQVNHVVPFLMTHLLQHQLKKNPGSRIVYVTNIIAYFGTLWNPQAIDQIYHSHENMINLWDYINSKCCQMIACKMFAEKFRGHDVTCNAVYPGWVDIEERKVHNNIAATNFVIAGGKIFLDFWIWLYGKTRLEGTQMNLHSSLSDAVSKTTGRLIWDNLVLPLPTYVHRKAYCEEVWNISEELCQLEPHEKLK